MPNYRSRNVAREIAYDKRDGLFAATPPLDVMKMLLSTLASGNRGKRLMVADVKWAYFHAKCKRLTYVKLPPEDVLPGEEHLCGRLNYSMYGTRDAAANWSEEYTERLMNMGFTVGKASPCVFYHAGRGLRAYVHGDDFVVTGMPAELQWMRSKIEEKYELKVEVLGLDQGQHTEVRVLNRILRWTAKGVSMRRIRAMWRSCSSSSTSASAKLSPRQARRKKAERNPVTSRPATTRRSSMITSTACTEP